MKKFFKKIAFVSAMAMVVSAMPAQSAAAAEGPQMYSTLKFYLGGDVTETYSDEARYAKVWNKDGYTVEFDIDNEDVATVSKKGKVTPVGVGTATVTATFTDEDGEEVEKTCVVTVKKNAVEAGISDASAKALTELTVGDTFQTKTYRTDADGVTSWKGKDVITDSARFASSNTDVFTVTKTGGYVKAVGAGEATLTVWAVQFEGAQKDANGNVVEYKATTAAKTYDVVVKSAGLLDAKQTKYNTVAITCGSADTAAAIAADVNKLAAAYVLNDNNVTAFVKSATVDSKDATVVNVELYNSLIKDTTYNFTYDDSTVSVVGVDLTAYHSIEIATTSVPAQEEAEVLINFYDANGIIVEQVTSGVVLTTAESGDYYINNSADKIYFFEAGKAATVTATYVMGYDENGNKIDDLTHTAVITSYDKYATSTSLITGWAIASVGATASSQTYSNDAFQLAVVDGQQQLFFKFGVTDINGTVTDNYNTTSTYFAGFEYTSTNDSVVLVDSVDGYVYPVAAGTAQIIVKSIDWSGNKNVVGVCKINVANNRAMTQTTVSLSKTKLSESADDSVTLKVDTKDQFGVAITPDVYNIELVKDIDGVEIQINTADGYTALVNDASGIGDSYAPTSYDGTVAQFTLQAIGTTATSPKTVQVAVTVTQYAPWNQVTKVMTLQVKQAGSISSYSLDLGKDAIDNNIAGRPSGATAEWYYNCSISLMAYDAQGYVVEKVAMTANTAAPEATGDDAAYSYTVYKGSTQITVDGDTFKGINYNVASGVAEAVKMDNGTYTVRVYKQANADAKVQLIAIKNIVVTDSSVALTVTQDSNTLTSAELATLTSALGDKLTFKRNGEEVTVEIVDVDVTVTNDGTKAYVTKVTVKETYDGYTVYWPYAETLTYTWDVAVGKVFTIAD